MRVVGGRIGMGNTRKPMAVSFQCMTKSSTNKKNKNKKIKEHILKKKKGQGLENGLSCIFQAIKKAQNTKVKVRETDLIWSQICSSLLQ